MCRFLLELMRRALSLMLLAVSCLITLATAARADSISDNPIVFVTMVPNPADFGTLAATFGNHTATPSTAVRGGDLWIRYPDGSLKNLTSAAGYGNTGFQGAGAIAVRDPSVHWDGAKVIFSMVVGAPTQQYQLTSHRWQLYEITGLGASETPVITKVAGQPANYNNISPTYTSDDSIIFVSDRPRDDTVLHTYPQRDEYESSPVNSGLWKLNVASSELKLLDHAPSGDFNPIVDSFGRVVFTRWDHLQRDQQNVGVSFGAFNYESEVSSTALSSAAEVFPEPRSTLDPDYVSTVNLHTFNQFFPWMMNQDGTGLETLNHVGRQEIGLYSERSFNNDPNVQEFYGQYTTGQNQNEFTIFLHIKEKPTLSGTYVGTSCQEFGTHASGQIISLTGAPGLNPDNMQVNYITHPDTAGATDNPSANHSGLYRDPLPLSNGKLIAAHTSNTRQDSNIGTSSAPLSRYDFRLKVLSQGASYFSAGSALTSGITKSISFWNPDTLVTYSGQLWELMPVELKSRSRPSATRDELPPVEDSLISSLNIDVAELVAYLKVQNLALVVSRNLTMRDRNDRQQPSNLRVTGTDTQTLPNSGTIYDISFLQFFQGDLIRAYQSSSSAGRRVLAQPMHSVADGVNMVTSGAPLGSVKLGDDGSMAAFVPAGRALSWQLTAEDGTPVVRERYWVTFQPGEIRVCASCHGINTADHMGNPAPQNSPQALAALLAHWKNLPASSIPSYTLKVTAKKKSTLEKFSVLASGGSSSALLALRAKLGTYSCKGSKNFASGKTSRKLSGKFPSIKGLAIKFSLTNQGSTAALKKTSLKLSGPSALKFSSKKLRSACSEMFASFK
ncbi:MAG: hypothetical protein K1X79_02400 [Oligoflexia bacterium]|nr:hypothetical protein [Oligoflexia bacterium]